MAAVDAPTDAPATAEDTSPEERAASDAIAEPEVEVYYTFSWAPKPRSNRPQQGGKPRGQGKLGGKPGKGKPRGGQGRPQDKGAKTYSSKPQKKDRIDPDNPFAAALMGLKDKT